MNEMNFSRRGFIASLAALGVAGAPRLWAETPPLKIQPIRGGGVDSVLSLTKIEIPVGAEAPFSALHISDTHLNFWNVADFAGNAKSEAHFGRRWVRFPQALASFTATLDYAAGRALPIFHTGDLLDWNTAANRAVLARTLKGENMFYAIGNHEYHSSKSSVAEALTGEQARDSLKRIFGCDMTVASRVKGGVNFVAFDNAEVNLRAETMARVKAEFDKGLPVVLMCHIPPVSVRAARFCSDRANLTRISPRFRGRSRCSCATTARRPVSTSGCAGGKNLRQSSAGTPMRRSATGFPTLPR